MATATELNVIIGAKLDSLEKGLSTANKKLDSFGRNTKKVGTSLKAVNSSVLDVAKGLGLAFGAKEIFDGVTRLIGDSFKLAAEAEGVGNAFAKLNRPDLLNNLQEATRGTVNNLELMRRSVQANNFKIPLDNLSTFFKFATNRAIETGESVDFLTNSIIVGLGRKSPLILDNLGISVIEIQQEFKKTGDFVQAAANIINRELAASGEVIDTASTSTQQFSAAFDNLKTSVGTFFTSGAGKGIINLFTGITKSVDQGVRSLNDDLNEVEQINKKIFTTLGEIATLKRQSTDPGIFDSIFGPSEDDAQKKLGDAILKLKQLNKERELLLNPTDGGGGSDDAILSQIGVIQELQEELKIQKELQLQAGEAALPAINQRIQQLNEEIKTLQNLGIEIDKNADKLRKIQEEELRDAFKFDNQEDETITDFSFNPFNDTFSITEAADKFLEDQRRIQQGLNDSAFEAYNFGLQIDKASQFGEHMGQVISSALGSIIGDLITGRSEAKNFGKVFLNIAGSLLGSALSGGVSSIFKGLFGGGGSVPGLATGTNYVPSDGLYRLHKGEAVVPRKYNDPFDGLSISTRVSGTDLVLVLDRTNRFKQRTQGGI